MKKKAVCLMIPAVFCLMLAGCGGRTEEDAVSASEVQEESVQTVSEQKEQAEEQELIPVTLN